MQYPLEEKIGVPELLVGRDYEFNFFHKWINGMPLKRSKSRVILARRKSGKTSFVQRIFNQLWSQNGEVIPFYFDIADKDVWYPKFAITYYRAFASQYLSFLERDPAIIRNPLTLEKILEHGVKLKNDAVVQDAEYILQHQDDQTGDLLWELASTAPQRYAATYNQRFLVILDEFQNIANHVYADPHLAIGPIKAMPGSFHSLSESKVAPMLVTGSYPGVLLRIMEDHLEAGRLSITRFEPYLTPEEGLLAVYKYAEIYDEPITNQAAQQINELCMADPFFISCVILSECKEKDLTTTEGVVNTVDYEITHRGSELSKTWSEYIRKTFARVNGTTTKNLMLFLNKHDDQYWTPQKLKSELNLDLSADEIFQRLELLAESDVIEQGGPDIDFRGLQDGTLNLVLRHRFEKEIEGFKPDFKTEFEQRLANAQKEQNRWRGRANYLEGLVAEHLLAIELRTKKYVQLSHYFAGIADGSELNVIDVQERVVFQRKDGRVDEIDIIAKSDDNRVVMIEVRKRQETTNLKTVKDLRDNADAYGEQNDVTVIPAFLSLGGFTKEAKEFCTEHDIGVAEEIDYYSG